MRARRLRRQVLRTARQHLLVRSILDSVEVRRGALVGLEVRGRLECELRCRKDLVSIKSGHSRAKVESTHAAICSWVCCHCWLEAANMAAMAEASSLSAVPGTTTLIGSCEDAREEK